MIAQPTGEPLSFDAVYEAWFAFVWRSARRMGVNDADIDDAVQDVFLTVHRRLHEFEGRSSMHTWLFGILLHVVQHQRRSKARRLNKLDAFQTAMELLPPKGDPCDVSVHREQAELLERLLARMDEPKRVVFMLVELEERPIPEVAALLQVNVNTVYSRLRAARLQLEDWIGRGLMRRAG